MEEKIVFLLKRGQRDLFYSEFIKTNAHRIILIQSEQSAALPPETKGAHVITARKYEEDQEIESILLQLSTRCKIVAICSTSESDVLRAAYWRDVFELKGQGSACAKIYRDKVEMKKYLQKHEIITPHFSRANKIDEVVCFSNIHGYPFILKPAQGGGSENVHIISSKNELALFRQNMTNEYFLCPGGINVEEYIKGIMYHIDGLVYEHKIVFSWPSQYINHSIELTHGQWLGSVLLDATNLLTKKLQDYASKVVAALPDPQGSAFHLELFIEEGSEKFILCEIASRPGGGLIRQILKKAFKVDIVAEHLLLQSGQRPNKYPSMPISYGGMLLLGAQKGLEFSSQECPDDPSVFLSDMWWKPGDVACPNAQGLANVMAQWGFTATDGDSAIQRVHRLANWIMDHTCWIPCNDSIQ